MIKKKKHRKEKNIDSTSLLHIFSADSWWKKSEDKPHAISDQLILSGREELPRHPHQKEHASLHWHEMRETRAASQGITAPHLGLPFPLGTVGTPTYLIPLNISTCSSSFFSFFSSIFILSPSPFPFSLLPYSSLLILNLHNG